MSNPFKSVGKIFKKVAKVVKKVAVPALMIGAVVLTGGAALGALPAMGAMLGSVGITGTLASVLGGAISAGAVGAVTGGIGGLVSGKGFMKGATGGFLAGAATGGIMGGLGMVSANGILADMGVGSQAANVRGLQAAGQIGRLPVAQQAIQQGIGTPAMTGVANGTSGAMSAAGSIAQPLPGLAGAGSVGTTTFGGGAAGGMGTAIGGAARAGGGLLGAIGGAGGIAPQLLQVGGQMLSGFAQNKAATKQAKAEIEARMQMERAEADRIAYNYGYRNTYSNKNDMVPSGQQQWHQSQPLSYAQPNEGLLRSAFASSTPGFMYQIVNGQVMAVPRGA